MERINGKMLSEVKLNNYSLNERKGIFIQVIYPLYNLIVDY